MSESLFRFVTIRRPEPSSLPRIELVQPAVVVSQDRIEALRQLEEAAGSHPVVRDPEEVPRVQELRRFRERLLSEPLSGDSPAEIAATVFGAPAQDLVAQPDWESTHQALNDSLLVLKFVPGDGPRPIRELADLLRTMTVIDALANTSLTLESARAFLTASLQSPPVFDRSDSTRRDAEDWSRATSEIREQARASVADLKELRALNRALDEVKAIEGLTHHDEDARDVAGKTVMGLAGQSLLTDPTLSLLKGMGLETPAASSPEDLSGRLQSKRGQLQERVSSIARRATPAKLVTFGPFGVLIPAGFHPAGGVMGGEGSAAMSLLGAGIGEEIDRIADDPRLTRVADEFRHGLDRQMRERIGRSLVTDEMNPSLLQPAGNGVLRLVRQTLVRYEPGEVAHIENVMQGELRRRTHTRRVSSERIFVDESETEKTEERDLQTTERSEISREIDEQVQSEQQTRAAVAVTADYGRVSVAADAELATRTSEEESRRTAVEMARETVDRAVSKVSERVLRRRETRLVEELEEINLHEFENQAANALPRTGVYQWVNKVYQAQVFNYGLRTWYDLIVPEPAAFLLYAAANSEVGLAHAVPDPGTFGATFDELDERYVEWMADYGAVGIDAPPANSVAVTKTFSSVGRRPTNPNDNFFAAAEKITVPDGYEALRAIVGFTSQAQGSDYTPLIGITVEGQSRQFHIETSRRGTRAGAEGVEEWPVTLTSAGIAGGPRGEVAVGITADNYSALAVNVTLECELTREAREKWRVDTYGAIHQAYLQRRAEYEDALARLEVRSTGSEFQSVSPHPLRMQEMIATELKRAAITLMSNEPPEFWPITYPRDPTQKPQIAYAVVRQGLERMGRFMEEAFEWRNMGYLFYPYFWGRPDAWEFRVLHEEADPRFAEFIRAGAARVLIPVRPGWEPAVDHFMMTKEPFWGGDNPPMGNALHLDFVEEAADALGRPGQEMPDGDSWEVIVPTTLLMLRTEAGLPDWKTE